MSEPTTLRTREQVAWAEVGHTAVSRAAAWVLVAGFLATILSVPLAQHAYDIRAWVQGRRDTPLPQAYDIFFGLSHAVDAAQQGEGGAFDRVCLGNRALLDDIRRYERLLEGESVVSRRLIPPAQYVLARWLGVGNEEVCIGRDGWLFYRKDLEYVIGPPFLSPDSLRRRSESDPTSPPQPDPVKAIVEFKDQLAARGITLILMPVPVKPVVAPEMLSTAYAAGGDAVQNPSWPEFKARLARAGVLVFDAAEALADDRVATGKPQYLRSDSHWRPEAMERTAARLKEFLTKHVALPPVPSPGYHREAGLAARAGDLDVMLKLPHGQTLDPPEAVTFHPVRVASGALWSRTRAADVLVLGDSFTNIYSLEAMGWGGSAGLVEQLSYLLNRPLDRLARNGDGAWATRRMLDRELAQGRDRLAGKRAVIWEFASRELSCGDWKSLEMRLGRPGTGTFFVPLRGTEVRLTGTVAAISEVPIPGSVPYRNHIMALHLADLEGDGEALEANEAVVYTWAMRENVWTAAAHLRVGQEVTFRLRPWADVLDKYQRINRSELENEKIVLEEPCWGEVMDE